MEHIVVLMVDLGQNLIFALLLIAKLETLAPSWANSNALAQQISPPAWEKLVILDKT
jgi:hypothetical protein